MAEIMVAHQPHRASVIPIRRLALAQKIDDLAELRGLLAQAQATEHALAGEILTDLAMRRVSRFEGAQTVATIQRGVAVTLKTAPRADRPSCSCCGGPREPLLEFEMALGERGDTDLCRACQAGEAA